MKKAFMGHASALRFTQNTAALLAILLLCASVTACTQTPDDSGDTSDTAPVTEETGMTLGQYVTQIKVDEAKRLMDVTCKSIAEIAEYLGYSSQSHFQRVFKKASGMTPGEYRNIK